MEHKWGRWVSELGVSSSGCTLASRLLGFPRFIATNGSFGITTTFRYWLEPLHEDDPYLLGVATKVPGFPHFPYGYLVEPDGPL